MVMTNNLLTGVNQHSVSLEPFPHLVVQDALVHEEYDTLASSFPADAMFRSGRPIEDNMPMRLSARDVVANTNIAPTWQAFFAEHTSRSYWLEIVRVFGDVIRTIHPDLENRVGKPLADFVTGIRGTPGKRDVSLECQFVVNTPSRRTLSVKTPHVDKRQTLFAGLFYMRAPDDKSEGGDLDLYTWNREPRFMGYRMILPSDVTKVSTIAYRANNLVCFVNSQRAVHGVSPRGPSPLSRRYINLIAETGFHLFKAPAVGPIARLQHWADAKAIRHRSRFY